ncbi:MAG: type II secretion system protein GspE, partial [Deltaproteobacteria bacterium]
MEHAKKTSKSRVKGHRKLGDLLVESGLIDRKTLAKALEIQKIQNKRLGQILIDMGVADDEEIARTLARQLDVPFLKLSRIKLPEDVISMVPADLAENHLLLPVKKDEKGLLVAMANPLDLYGLDDLRFVTQMPVRIVVSPEREIIDAIGRYYPGPDLERKMDSGPPIDEGIEIIQHKEPEEKDLTEIEDILDLTERPPVVRLTNAILADAIKMGASDIHIEPQKTAVLIRYRIDGILREIMQTDRHVHASLVSRIKVISNMDV